MNTDVDNPITAEAAGPASTRAESAAPPATPPAPGGATRALLAGLLVALALGVTLLTWALSLMFMLGLFFFMLFGLLVGAVMFRFGVRSRPMPRGRVVLISAAVAFAGWSAALTKEAVDFPRDFVDRVVNQRKFERDKLHIPPGEGEYDKICGQVATFITDHLAQAYPPGGVIGYFQYTGAGDTIIMDLPGQPRKLTIKPRVQPWIWWTRGLLSLPLFFLTIYSVTAALARMPSESELKRRYY